MAKKKPGKKSSSKKIRMDFRKNRLAQTRDGNLTHRYDPDAREDESDALDAEVASQRLTGPGERTRRRTVIGETVATDNDSGGRGDFVVLPDVSTRETRSGRVRAVFGLYSAVEEIETGEIFTCVTRRILKTLATDQRQIVVTGDRVRFRDAENPTAKEGIIERVEPRSGSLSRTSRGRKHIIVTNVDQAVIVASCAEPRLKPNLIDRLLLSCERAGIRPIICLNKVDLIDPATLAPLVGVYSQMGYRVVPTSVETGIGIARFRRFFHGRVSVVVGQSGVGKSSILNAVDPLLDLRTGQISLDTQKGTHTTTTAELLRLSAGGWVVDTPGVRQFTLWDIIPEEVFGFYRDLRPYENLCRYPDCSHTHEDHCAVKDAVADGRVSQRRYESYLALRAGELEGL